MSFNLFLNPGIVNTRWLKILGLKFSSTHVSTHQKALKPFAPSRQKVFGVFDSDRIFVLFSIKLLLLTKVPGNNCKEKRDWGFIIQTFTTIFFTFILINEIRFSKVRSCYDPFAYFSYSFISGESMVII